MCRTSRLQPRHRREGQGTAVPPAASGTGFFQKVKGGDGVSRRHRGVYCSFVEGPGIRPPEGAGVFQGLVLPHDIQQFIGPTVGSQGGFRIFGSAIMGHGYLSPGLVLQENDQAFPEPRHFIEYWQLMVISGVESRYRSGHCPLRIQ
jgi:hypothetical protein